MTQPPDHILLIGGGHAHVAVLADWIRRGLPAARATLVTPEPHLRYSGMVPGWIAGQYERDVGIVDIAALAERAGAEFVQSRCAAIDPDVRYIVTEDGRQISFDIASIDTGGVGRAADVLGQDKRLLDIRPIDRFVGAVVEARPAERIAVIGGGAGGTELAFALKNRSLRSASPQNPSCEAAPLKVALITGANGLLPDFSSPVREVVAKELRRQGINVITHNAKFEDGRLFVGGEEMDAFDLVVGALGSGAPDWPEAGGMVCDEDGFIAVDAYQRSVSHQHILAAGDVAARQDRNVPHSGVHAVFAGPVLAHNLRALMHGKEPSRSYRPRRHNLYLMSTGDGSAIASYGPFAAQGAWVRRLKHWIDNRWIQQYAALVDGRES